MKKEGRFPAYIPSASFIGAVIHIVGEANYESPQLKEAITNALLPGSFKKLLLDLLAESANNRTVFEEKLAAFYDNAMERASGWYKKKVRTVLLVLGFGLSVALNIDTVEIMNNALKDKARLGYVSGNIANDIPATGNINDYFPAGKAGAVQHGKNVVLAYEQATGRLLGYDDDFIEQWKQHFFLKLAGMIITAFALQLGAGYWFAVMNKVVNVRSAGNKPKNSNK